MVGLGTRLCLDAARLGSGLSHTLQLNSSTGIASQLNHFLLYFRGATWMVTDQNEQNHDKK